MTSYLFHSAVPARVRLVFSALQLCHPVYLAPFSPPLPPPSFTAAATCQLYQSAFNASLFYHDSLANAIVLPRARARDGTVAARSFPALPLIPRRCHYGLIIARLIVLPPRMSGRLFGNRPTRFAGRLSRVHK